MSLQVGGLCFILLCYFLAASTNVLPKNIRSEEVIIDFYRTLTLHCIATEVPGATVVWRREDSRNITLRSGVYICTTSNGVDPSVRKRFIVHVNHSPIITIPRTHRHVHALLGEDATFRCHVEAQPSQYPAITLVNSSKYVIEESQLNEHTTLMQLTVRNLEPADYLRYSCTSYNRLGGAEYKRRLLIHEIISTEEVKIDQWQTLTLLCNATEVPGATVVWRREDSRNITLRSKYEYKYVKKVLSSQYPEIPLVNSSKYVIVETQRNEHTTLMKLTVRNVETADYLIYTCTSRNHLGGQGSGRLLRNQSIEHLL
ncbi:hypothetical protein B566_EDAN014727 [Ephemera danica]|nr:hypothetical protein B566_EDAN014727 [Ephemera danica]